MRVPMLACAFLLASAATTIQVNAAVDEASETALPKVPTAMPRGVLRAYFDKYDFTKNTNNLFTCLDGSQTIPFSRVNDEYCDCKDGSDEPGTAACTLETINNKAWRFRCADSGSAFKDRTFRHSSVNDGICDCCDGSDEYNGLVQCPDTCAELAAEEDKIRREREEKRRQGLEAKREMEKVVEEKIAAALRAVAEEEKKLADAEAAMAAVREEKDRAEAVEKTEKDALLAKHNVAVEQWTTQQATRLSQPENLKPFWGCVRWAQTRDCKGEGELEQHNLTCSEIIASASSGMCVCRKRTPEYLAKIRAGEVNVKEETAKRDTEITNSVTDKEARRKKLIADIIHGDDDAAAAEAAAQKKSLDEEDDEMPEEDKLHPVAHAEAFRQQQEDRLVGVEKEDTLLKYDCGHTPFTCDEMCEYGGNLDLKLLHDASYDGETTDGSRFETQDAKTAREKMANAESDKQRAENAIADAKKVLANLQQEDIAPAFRSMHGLCYERQFHNYKYSFCPFSKASQDYTSLGTWKGFGEQTYSSWGAKHDFSVMKFEGGQTCWGGPARSLTVRIVCGPSNEILSVDEPSMCMYLLKFQSPAICE